MSSNQKLRTFRLAAALLAHRALVNASGVANPDAYLRALTDQKRARHFDRAMALLEERPGITESELAELLEPGHVATIAPQNAPGLELVDGDWWEGRQSDSVDSEAARDRIAAIRAALKENR